MKQRQAPTEPERNPIAAADRLQQIAVLVEIPHHDGDVLGEDTTFQELTDATGHGFDFTSTTGAAMTVNVSSGPELPPQPSAEQPLAQGFEVAPRAGPGKFRQHECGQAFVGDEALPGEFREGHRIDVQPAGEMLQHAAVIDQLDEQGHQSVMHQGEMVDIVDDDAPYPMQ